jgi:hypothetical protein
MPMPVQPKPNKAAFVYDKSTGKVVLVLRFIPLDPKDIRSDGEMEKEALDLAADEWDTTKLAVHHSTNEQELKLEHHYRVDVKEHRLIAEPAPPHPRSRGA